jgi:hypothetical protein
VLRGSLVCSSRKCGTTDPLSRGAGSGIWSVRYHWETVLVDLASAIGGWQVSEVPIEVP